MSSNMLQYDCRGAFPSRAPPLNVQHPVMFPAAARLNCPIMRLQYTPAPPTHQAQNDVNPPRMSQGQMFHVHQPHGQPNPTLGMTDMTDSRRASLHPNAASLSAGDGNGSQTGPLPNIRQKEQEELGGYIVQGGVLQVSGPPMVGKKTLLNQVLGNLKNCNKIIEHQFTCNGAESLQDVLLKIAQTLQQPNLFRGDLTIETLLQHILQMLKTPQMDHYHHVFVFNNCEAMKCHNQDGVLVDFFYALFQNVSKVVSKVTVVFTTYMRFRTTPVWLKTFELGVLEEVWDVLSIIQFYTSHAKALDYVQVFLKFLPLPDAIRRVSEIFLADEDHRNHPTPDMLEKEVNGSAQLLEDVFGPHEHKVPCWLTEEDLMLLLHFSHSIKSTFSQEHLRSVIAENNDFNWNRLLKRFQHNYVLRKLSWNGNLAVHPLVVYYVIKNSIHDRQVALQRQRYDQSCNRYTNFMCRILMTIEENRRLHGKKGMVYGCVAQEEPKIRYLIQMALHCNVNTYQEYLKVAVVGIDVITKCMGKEAVSFFSGMYNSAIQTDRPRVEQAILQAFLGHSIAVSQGSGLPLGIKHMSAALKCLEQYGLSHFLNWTEGKLAIAYHRSGKYAESLSHSKKALQRFDQLTSDKRRVFGEAFFVSETQVDKEKITQLIHMAIPLIFLGKNDEARRLLNEVLELINGTFENHPELYTLFNLIGLTEQRGNADLKKALEWYKLSYRERSYERKICPDIMLVVLNNIGMILLELGRPDECMRYLNEALEICNEIGRVHYHTALTMTHLCEVYMKSGNFVKAFRYIKDASDILAKTVEHHDMRLRVTFTLAHVRVGVDHQLRQQRERAGHPEGMRERERCAASAARNTCAGAEVCSGGQGGNEANVGNVPLLCQLLSSQYEGSFEDANSCNNNNDRVGQRYVSQTGSCSQNNGSNNCCYESQNRCEACPGHNQGNGGFGSPNNDGFLDDNGAEEEPEPADLRMSAEDHLIHLHELYERLNVTLSDHGVHNILSTLELIMMFNLHNSRDVYEKYKKIYVDFETSRKLGLAMGGGTPTRVPDTRHNRNANHSELYNYIVRTDYQTINLNRFVLLATNICTTCKISPNFFTEQMWSNEVRRLVQARQQKSEKQRRISQMLLPGDNDYTQQRHTDRDADQPAPAPVPVFMAFMPDCSAGQNVPRGGLTPRHKPLLNQSRSDVNDQASLISPPIVQDQQKILDDIQQRNRLRNDTAVTTTGGPMSSAPHHDISNSNPQQQALDSDKTFNNNVKFSTTGAGAGAGTGGSGISASLSARGGGAATRVPQEQDWFNTGSMLHTTPAQGGGHKTYSYQQTPYFNDAMYGPPSSSHKHNIHPLASTGSQPSSNTKPMQLKTTTDFDVLEYYGFKNMATSPTKRASQTESGFASHGDRNLSFSSENGSHFADNLTHVQNNPDPRESGYSTQTNNGVVTSRVNEHFTSCLVEDSLDKDSPDVTLTFKSSEEEEYAQRQGTNLPFLGLMISEESYSEKQGTNGPFLNMPNSEERCVVRQGTTVSMSRSKKEYSDRQGTGRKNQPAESDETQQ